VSTVTTTRGTAVTTSDRWSISKSGNNGCNGGSPRACWAYNNQSTALASWECYPFTSGTTRTPGKCSIPKCNVQVRAMNYVTVAANNEQALLQAVNIGPVACGMMASTLQNYAGGIFTGAGCTKTPNHAITVVGYGTENGQDYWLIKNSWGPKWGQNGYFQLQRGSNLCGIASSCAYPVVLPILGGAKDAGSGSPDAGNLGNNKNSGSSLCSYARESTVVLVALAMAQFRNLIFS